MKVKWKAKPGYGDLISPICYAHNLSEYLKEQVELEFVYFNSKGVRDRYEKDESENVEYRGNKLFSMVSKGTSDVVLKRTYDINLPVQHTNLFDRNKFHNYRLASNHWKQENAFDYVTFITTENNKVPFTDYPKPSAKIWKDPVDNWSDLYNQFEHKKFIDYDTKLDDAVKILLHTDLVIGYHGSATWLARFLGVPSVILSAKEELTRKSFPSAIVSRHLEVTPSTVEDYQQQAMYKLQQHKNKGDVIWMPE